MRKCSGFALTKLAAVSISMSGSAAGASTPENSAARRRRATNSVCSRRTLSRRGMALLIGPPSAFGFREPVGHQAQYVRVHGQRAVRAMNLDVLPSHARLLQTALPRDNTVLSSIDRRHRDRVGRRPVHFVEIGAKRRAVKAGQHAEEDRKVAGGGKTYRAPKHHHLTHIVRKFLGELAGQYAAETVAHQRDAPPMPSPDLLEASLYCRHCARGRAPIDSLTPAVDGIS